MKEFDIHNCYRGMEMNFHNFSVSDDLLFIFGLQVGLRTCSWKLGYTAKNQKYFDIPFYCSFPKDMSGTCPGYFQHSFFPSSKLPPMACFLLQKKKHQISTGAWLVAASYNQLWPSIWAVSVNSKCRYVISTKRLWWLWGKWTVFLVVIPVMEMTTIFARALPIPSEDSEE